MLPAPCLWTPLAAIYKTCCALVRAVTTSLSPNFAWHGERSGNSCLSSLPGTSCLKCVARCTQPAIVCLCSMVAKHGYQMHLTCSGSDCYAAVTDSWSTGSMASKTETKHAQHQYSNLELRILWQSRQQSFAVGSFDGLDMYSVPRPVSSMSQT